MKPRTLDAQGTPRFRYICVAKSGNAPPKVERTRVFAAMAELANIMYTSMR